ncbi:Rasrelated protein Rac1, putative [Acanthamoeba castellanii str. Neff]|uniref:Rasrelated protein Rac1, putative n=1 Tax=Acanthamoeba castellanii (strain ATCC 30010 / Neff) TaxID=1257118 RepID=L8GP33_ACACF|nr:Rasrelated protein Rac1, putative [Acanthamoeba castellanii str. Neff]ELR14642.1 Rasrelated protein Rac1, putative [Acanthamoeba castellanii str. Neff]
MAEYQVIKCVVVGNSAVGKTCLLISYTTNTFPGEYMPTIFNNYSANMFYNNHKVINLSLWDTASQEEYNHLHPLSYPHTNIFMLCYSAINPVSLANIKQKWLPKVHHHCPKAPILLVTTKSNLHNNHHMVAKLQAKLLLGVKPCMATKQGHKLANEIRATTFIKCLAWMQDNLTLIFNEAICVALKLPPAKKKKSGKHEKKCSLF